MNTGTEFINLHARDRHNLEIKIDEQAHRIVELEKIVKHREEMLIKAADGWKLVVSTRENPFVIRERCDLYGFSNDEHAVCVYQTDTAQSFDVAGDADGLVGDQ